MFKRFSVLLLVLCMLSGLALAGDANALSTTVKEVDKYGNVHLVATGGDLTGLGWLPGDLLTVVIGDEAVSAPLGRAYSDVDTGSLVVRAKEDDAESLIIAINMGNLADTYGVAEGDAIVLEMDEPGGYLDEYNMRQLAQFRTYDRADYDSDEVYANFRPIVMGGIPQGVLYRSSSPVNNEISRAAFADGLAEAAGIATVINLADSDESLAEHYEGEDFASPYYQSLEEEGRVILLDMGVDFSTDAFKEQLAHGLRFMTRNAAPYLVHCNEGKDRAGFVSALLEALMGADADAIAEDYMASFVNFYHVEPGSEQYAKIADSNILETLRGIAGLEKGADLTGVDLAEAARAYLLDIGLREDEIDMLQGVLSGQAAASAA